WHCFFSLFRFGNYFINESTNCGGFRSDFIWERVIRSYIRHVVNNHHRDRRAFCNLFVLRSEERREGKSVDLRGGRRIREKKEKERGQKRQERTEDRHTENHTAQQQGLDK